MADDGLVAALARCQAIFPPIVKSHTNPAFKGSQYADVADVLAVVRPVLAAEGIVVMQVTDVSDETGGVDLITKLMLGSEVMVSRFPLHIANLTPQGVGSLMTYIRRYQLCAVLGVHPEGDDDDGNAAQSAPARTQARQWMPPVIGSASGEGITADSYALAAATPPEKPLAAMTAGEMARYGELIGVRVSGSKADILKQLEPIVLAASGEEPFLVDSPTTSGREGDGDGSDAGTAQGTAASPPPSPDAIPFDPPPDPANAPPIRPGPPHKGFKPEQPAFEPSVFVGAADESGTARRQGKAARADV